MATEITTTVPGNIWKVLVKEGDIVKIGDTLFINLSRIDSINPFATEV